MTTHARPLELFRIDRPVSRGRDTPESDFVSGRVRPALSIQGRMDLIRP